MFKSLLSIVLIFQLLNISNFPQNNGTEKAEKKVFELRSGNEWDVLAPDAQFQYGVFSTGVTKSKIARALLEHDSLALH